MRDDILHVVLPIVLTDFVNGLLSQTPPNVNGGETSVVSPKHYRELA